MSATAAAPPPAPPTPPATSTLAKRTRTGCKTCRTRKLKCDEQKPICGQCRKSSRECVPSEGVAFRHAQNAGFGSANDNDLANFYKYRQKFNQTYFLPVPRELSFIHITDPYADDNSLQSSSATAAAQASQASQAAQHNMQQNLQQNFMRHMPQQGPQYADVAASSLAMIDPNLDQGHTQMQAHNLGGEEQKGAAPEHHLTADMGDDNLNDTILKALKETDEKGNSLQPKYEQ